MLKKLFGKIITKIIPIKNNRIVFMSFNGHYSDSPKYISNALFQISNKLDIIWLVEGEYINLVPKEYKAIEINTLKAYYYYGSAKVIIDNVYGKKEAFLTSKRLSNKIFYNMKNYYHKKRHQKVYTTWHGTPLKRMGIDQIATEIIDFNCPNTTMILGNKYTLDIMKRLTFNKIKMELIGTPRNDILLKEYGVNINELKRKLKLPIDKKIILFAPTFRTDVENNENNVERSGINQVNEIDFDLLFDSLNNKFGGDWIFVCRFHYHVEKIVNWDELNVKYNGKIVNGNKNDDMAEYLACSDILISDISSCLFDFALTRKPSFIYFPDREYYENKERGLYIKIEELPFSCSENFNDLLKQINCFDEIQYTCKVNKLIKKLNYVDNENSSNEIANFIINDGELR